MADWTWWQTWTFWPAVVVAFALPIVTLPAYLSGYITPGEALGLPWIGLSVACAWVSTVGQTVTP